MMEFLLTALFVTIIAYIVGENLPTCPKKPRVGWAEPDMTQLEWEQNRSFWAATVKQYCPYEEFVRRAFAPEECR